jgi:hypothetical protein
LTLQYRTDLQAVHVFNVMSSHSSTPQAAQNDNDVSASSLIFLRNIVSRPLSKMRQQ